MRILIVEDEIELSDIIKEGLEIDGYSVDQCFDGEKAMELISLYAYDLLILDLNLPKKDGLELLKELRTFNQEIRIVILSARSSIDDKVKGLDLGANDYLAKPFAFEELEARIRSLLRRKFRQENTDITFDKLVLDTISRQVYISGVALNLTKKELAILEYLLLNQKRIISQEELFEHVWDMEADEFSNAVRVHIASLRKKIKQNLNKDIIATKVGQGYTLVGDSDV